jgi:hypothetical protein
MPLPHFGGQSYYCPICYSRKPWMKPLPCKCNLDGKELLLSKEHHEMLIKNKLYLRTKKMERINEREEN